MYRVRKYVSQSRSHWMGHECKTCMTAFVIVYVPLCTKVTKSSSYSTSSHIITKAIITVKGNKNMSEKDRHTG